MANHGVTEVVGIGNIILNTDTGSRLTLKDVRHIPDIRLNIISTGKLDDVGYDNHFGEGKWKLTKGSLIVAKGQKQNSLYGLEVLTRKKLLPEVTSMPLQTCVDCLIGKQHRVAFKSFSPSRKSHPLDLVHTDLCYMKDRSLGGAIYFVTFINDFSRKVCVLL
ncbi:hypothetical protein DH2020_019683 [Rehmannia glutinosa]|uniref:Retrovirus-related Pol polyprotein from transposon TNT 1-94-like beta-barrel domain-containing protein n=1 Tax=Rehmannia glutinosa TaxID=99300 RepID=A0ABR0WHJ7_REHGL